MIAHTYTCLVTTDIQVSKHQGLYKLIIAQQQSNRHQSTKILTHTTMQILSYKERLLAFLAHYYFIFFQTTVIVHDIAFLRTASINNLAVAIKFDLLPNFV